MIDYKTVHEGHSGKLSDKWESYFQVYSDILYPFIGKGVRLLEIGVQNGGSLEVEAKYLKDAELILGVDIDERCSSLKFEQDVIDLIVGDATSGPIFEKIKNKSSWFDIVIDDGSHTSRDIVKAFSLYFPMIRDGGVFIAEDLHCSYWAEWNGGLYHPLSSISFFKALADVVNQEFWLNSESKEEFLKHFQDYYDCDFEELQLEKIHSVKFYNSICVVEKRSAGDNKLGKRIIRGQKSLDSTIESYKLLTSLEYPDQAQSIWSKSPFRNPVKVDELYRLPEIISENEQLKITISQLESEIEKINLATDNLKNSHTEVVENLHATVHEIRSSFSWKITRPVRWIGFLRNNWANIKAVTKAGFNVYGPVEGLKRIGAIIRDGDIESIKERLTGKYYQREEVARFQEYQEWIKLNDRTDEQSLSELRKVRWPDDAPLLSVVMPVYNPNPIWLQEAIQSVIDQTYSNWEFMISDDASTDPTIRPILERYEKIDSRITVVYRSENGHISRSTNSAIQRVSGDWIVLLDHDDLLSPKALSVVALAIKNNPGAKVIYSDEDKISETGVRKDPYFKSDFNYDLFLSHNMISHLGVYDAHLIKDIGGFRVGYEGAQDYDLALRCLEKIEPFQIVHIPEILYHWRIHEGSTAGDSETAKPYAMLAGERAINDYFIRNNISAQTRLIGGGYKATYDLPIPQPLVSIIIPTRNGFELLKQCIDSILDKTSYGNYDILVIDNGSDEDDSIAYLELIEEDERIQILRDESPFNYSALNNKAALIAKGEYLAFLNNDVEVISPEWLEEMVMHAAHSDIGAVGAKLLYPNGLVQHSGVVLGLGGVAGHVGINFPSNHHGHIGRLMLCSNFSAVTAACMVVSKEKFIKVGMFNETALAVAFNDVDLCLRLDDLGYRTLLTPFVQLYHHESASRGLEDTPEKKNRLQRESDYMYETWGDRILKDKYYSSNLSLSKSDFSLAFPPRG